jgi:monoterpene epsilon-lactone hydrolase
MTSLRSRILHITLQRVTGAIALDHSVQEQRTRLDELTRRGIRLPRGVTVCAEQAGGVHAEWVEPSGTDSRRVILYLHGGGYCICSLDTHRGLAARLALAAQARVLNIAYRLAPENPFPAALEDAQVAYRWLLEQGIPPKQIAIGGDSAGGGLTLAAAVSLRDAGEPLPAALFLLSPWTDLTFSGESIQSRRAVDPIFGHDGGPQYVSPYVGDYDPAHPLISPLFADLHGLPPTLVHVGHDEILLDDSTRLRKKLKAARVESNLKVWEGMWHVFQVFAPYIPEAQQSIDIIGEFICKRTSDQRGKG